MTKLSAKAGRALACPICGKPPQVEHRPFCSARCAKIDCNRWLSDVYVVPGDETVPLAGTGGSDESDED
jgi:endogenous inhibitor of DNA gyrase (YacG/DUF329 family)